MKGEGNLGPERLANECGSAPWWLSLYLFRPALPRFSQRGAVVAERSEMLRAPGKVAAGAGSPMVVSRGWFLRRQALLDFSELF